MLDAADQVLHGLAVAAIEDGVGCAGIVAPHVLDKSVERFLGPSSTTRLSPSLMVPLTSMLLPPSSIAFVLIAPPVPNVVSKWR
jgi:hypothetical protein